MYALIMAGGEGTRLDLGEKPLISICGRPMIAYVTDAFTSAGCRVIVAASPKTPMTRNWCRALEIPCYNTEGAGFIEDMIGIVKEMDEKDPLFISVSDIPCVTPAIIQSVFRSYLAGNRDALSVWVPSVLVKSCRGGMPYRERIDGVEACPAGINILRGDRIDQTQDEISLLLDDPRLALNVNTRADRVAAEEFMKIQAGRKSDL
ncbi:NTP transferase domain-containing protein [uncultured Methanoregula sp.]|uniref:NTP transferase domain-containing protein n=1 Tax=uncultured Methanoregula sp. TaxID=1005933 RepID=UPI002AAC33CF|nr:NTP transferase domain-containing protein [uncultured Methanoregula sp.]